MRISYEPADIQEMARQVVKEIMPLLVAEIREVVKQQPSPIATTEPPRTVTAPSATGAVVARKELRALTGLSLTTLWRMEREGLFPRRVQLSASRVGWMRADIEAWMETRAAA